MSSETAFVKIDTQSSAGVVADSTNYIELQAEAAAVLDEVSAELDADLVFVTVNNSILAGKTEEEYAELTELTEKIDGELLFIDVISLTRKFRFSMFSYILHSGKYPHFKHLPRNRLNFA